MAFGLGSTLIPMGLSWLYFSLMGIMTIMLGVFGSIFNTYTAHELLFRVKDAISLYRNPDEWGKLITGAMTTDFTWDRSAKKYLNLYRGL